jgi:CubicO group peptidase (beta-lactamase class C family)
MSAGTEPEGEEGTISRELLELLAWTVVLGADPDRVARRVRRVRPAGEALDLASVNTQALAAVVSAVYDSPLAAVVETKIWGPFGMTSDASWSQHAPGPGGVALGFCCWNATLLDIARFGEVLRRGGAWGEVRLLPEGWVEAASEPSAPFAAPGSGGELGPWGYGLHVFIPADAEGEFLLAGEYGQYLFIDRRRERVVAVTAADGAWRDRREEATAVLRAIAAAVDEPP